MREMTMHRGSATAGAKLIPEGVGDGQGAMPISTRCSDRAVTTSGEVSSSTSIRRVGSYCRNEAMIAGRRLPDIEGTQPITSRPCRIAEMLRTVDKPSAISAKPLSTRFNKPFVLSVAYLAADGAATQCLRRPDGQCYAFEALAPSHRKEFARWIAEARRE